MNCSFITGGTEEGGVVAEVDADERTKQEVKTLFFSFVDTDL